MAESANDDLFLLLILGTSGTLALALFIISFFFLYQKRILVLQQQKQKLEMEFQENMSKAQLEAQEQDRARIAADLHDSVGSLLWAAKLNASFIERSVPLNNAARESHNELLSILDQTIQTVRRISWQLTPEAFQHAGLAQSLEHLCTTLDGKGIAVAFHAQQPAMWNDGKALHVFRIVQELVSNSVKHSRANRIDVSLSCPDNTLLVSVEDDGIGYQPKPQAGGVGWWSIRQRARQIGAELAIGLPPSGRGFSVTVTLPLAS